MLNKRATYGDDWDVPSAEHPAGACLNRSAPGAEDGSYLEKAWVNDLMAFPGAIINAAGYTPNGVEDTATASQVFDALINKRWSSIGNYSPGTVVTASNGNQYYCNKENGRDSSVIDPSTDSSDTWREYPYKRVVNANGTAKLFYNGDVEMFGIGTAFGANQEVGFISLPVSLYEPIRFDTTFITAIHFGTNPLNTNIIIHNDTAGKKDKISVKTSLDTPVSVSWQLKGRWA